MGLSGIYAGSMLMMYWYPRGYDPLTNGVRNGNIAMGVTTGIYLIREFSPELKRMFHRRKFAKGHDLLFSSPLCTRSDGSACRKPGRQPWMTGPCRQL